MALPNKWSMQQIVDLSVDKNDHIGVINRSDTRPDELGAATKPPRADCCILGPEILEFDPSGNVIRGWGTSDYAPGWPGRLQSMIVVREGNVWRELGRETALSNSPATINFCGISGIAGRKTNQ
jgi:hypothetical protein